MFCTPCSTCSIHVKGYILVLFLLLSLLAEVLGTIGGFGSSVFFVPIGSYFLDIKSLLGITALFHVSSNLSKIALFRKGFDKKVILWIGIPSVVLVAAGAFMSKYVDKKILELGLSIFLILMSVLFMVRKNMVIKPGKLNSILGGSLSGFLAGFLGTGGAVRGMVMAAFNLEKEVFVASSAVIDLAVDITRSVVYIYNGYVHTHDLYLIPFLLVVSLAGTWIGKKILKKIPQQKFRTLVLVLILLVGVATLLGYFEVIPSFAS